MSHPYEQKTYQQLLGCQWWVPVDGWRDTQVLHITEFAQCPFRELVQRILSKKDQLHDTGRVILVIKLNQLFSSIDAFSLGSFQQRFQVASTEMPIRMSTTREMFPHLKKPSRVHLKISFKLVIHSLHLSFRAALVEQWRYKELRKSRGEV